MISLIKEKPQKKQYKLKIFIRSISLFEQILQGSSFEITDEDQESLRIISIILGNNELYQMINQINPQYINNRPIEELIDELIVYEELSTKEFNYSNIIDRLSRDFSKIDKNRFGTLPKTVLYPIIKNNHSERKNEDELFDLISEILKSDDDEKV